MTGAWRCHAVGAAALALSLAACPTPAGAEGAARPWFENVAAAAGLSDAKAKRVDWVDLDGDGWLDIVLDLHSPRLSRAASEGRTFVEPDVPLGLDQPREPTLALWGDIDGDGDRDLLSVRYQEPEKAAPDPTDETKRRRDETGAIVPAKADDGTRTRVLLNRGDGRLVPLPLDPTFADHPESTSAATFLDFDRDGRLDLFLGNWYREYGWSIDAHADRLLRGHGDGTFEDVTAAAGFDERREGGHPDSARPTYGATAVDWNGDGLTDLLTASYGRQWNRLWKNLGDGTFVDVAAETGFDGDEIRTGEYPCIERETEQPFRANGNTFDVGAADHDNDGDVDVFLGEITHWWAGPSSDLSMLLVNQGPDGDHAFERVLPRGLARRHEDPWRWNQGDIHVGWLDFDNDGLLDLLVASGDYPDGQYLRLHRQRPDGEWEDVTAEAGFDWEGSGSLSLGDHDRDGDVDILVGRSLFRLPKEKREELGPAPALFRNDVGQDAHWIALRLVGAGADRGAATEPVGAEVILETADGMQSRRVMSSLGHAGHQDAPELHFGLGDARRIVRLTIRWPDRAGSVDVLEDLPVDRYLEIVQRPDAPPRVRRLRFR